MMLTNYLRPVSESWFITEPFFFWLSVPQQLTRISLIKSEYVSDVYHPELTHALEMKNTIISGAIIRKRLTQTMGKQE